MPNLVLAIGNKAYSSWSLRPWLLMRQAGIGFEEIRLSLYEEGAKQRLLQYSAAGKVPVVSRLRTYGVTLAGKAGEYAGAIHALPAMQEWIAGAHAETEVNPQYES